MEVPVLDGLKAGFWGYWAVCNKGIYFVDRPLETSHIVPNQPAANNQASIQFFSLESEQLKRIAKLEKMPDVGDSAFAVSPDGRYILYSQIDQSDSDIVLATQNAKW